MRQAPHAPTKPPPVPVACAHCGLEVPPLLVCPGEEEQYCCAGCCQVRALIRQWGYDDYYRLVRAQGGELGPARVAGRSFADFDDPTFQEQFCKAAAGRRRCAELYLEGVHCAACVWLVERLPEVVSGLEAVRLNLATSVARVVWDPEQGSLAPVARALDALGYTPHPHVGGQARRLRQAEDRALLMRLGVAAACAMNIMFLQGALYAGQRWGMDPEFDALFRWLVFALSLPVLLYCARPFYRAAWAGLWRGVPHMDLPIALALTAAFAYSAAATVRGGGEVYLDSLAALVALLLGARYVQRGAQRRALERAETLRSAAFVEFARRLQGDGPLAPSVEVPLVTLRAGDRLEVRSGELVPVDGTVVHGYSQVDNGVLTGESAPVEVQPGDRVWAGATNLGARLAVGVEATGERTRVGALLAVVQEAMARRPPIVELADRLSRVFVSVVLGLAALAAVLWIGDSPAVALQHVVALLVVTCPCALGMATPLALSVGITRAAQAGIFVKSPEALERLRRAGTVVLDKTGTLTEGRAQVSGWRGAEAARDLACALEAECSHPVAQAFRRAYEPPLYLTRPASGVHETPGLGVAGLVGGLRVAVGNRRLLDSLGTAVPPDLAAHARALLAAGQSPLYVVVGDRVSGIAGVGDPLRPDATATVAALGRLGLQPRILSGDHPQVVVRVAARLGLPADAAQGGTTPEDKRDFVAALVEARPPDRAVVMVGDGVNDAAAMALADVGVAVHGGAGASILAADVVLTREGLSPLLDLLAGSHRVLAVVWRNLGFSLVYNAAGAALALAGIVGPLLAAVLMPISSLAVILSSALSPTFPAPQRRSGAQAGERCAGGPR
ncbi:MAG: heavy metal translocating P-type ATPase [Candidatus Latescibacterota bacterium]